MLAEALDGTTSTPPLVAPPDACKCKSEHRVNDSVKEIKHYSFLNLYIYTYVSAHDNQELVQALEQDLSGPHIDANADKEEPCERTILLFVFVFLGTWVSLKISGHYVLSRTVRDTTALHASLPYQPVLEDTLVQTRK